MQGLSIHMTSKKREITWDVCGNARCQTVLPFAIVDCHGPPLLLNHWNKRLHEMKKKGWSKWKNMNDRVMEPLLRKIQIRNTLKGAICKARRVADRRRFRGKLEKSRRRLAQQMLVAERIENQIQAVNDELDQSDQHDNRQNQAPVIEVILLSSDPEDEVDVVGAPDSDASMSEPSPEEIREMDMINDREQINEEFEIIENADDSVASPVPEEDWFVNYDDLVHEP